MVGLSQRPLSGSSTGRRYVRVPIHARGWRSRRSTSSPSERRPTDRPSKLNTFTQLRVVGPDTDLWVNVAGREWLAADGKLNMPDGEIFTSPVESATEGEIRFSFPAIFQGRGVEDVRLRFEGGRVVRAEAGSGNDFLQSLLDMDDGARILGEVAFGLNYEIDRFTRDILLDEKD